MGNDVPDFKPDSKPQDHMGPFIMNPEGVGRIFVPLGAMADGPFPEYYEPIESPMDNPLHPNQSNNPVVKKFKTAMDKYGTAKEGYNIVCTTYRLTEHYHYWTKNNPMNVQLVPEPFVEIPAELADQMGIRGGEKVKVTSARSDYIAKAMVTKRIKPMMMDGKKTLPDRHADPLGLPGNFRRRRQDGEDAGQLAVADRHRPQRLHTGIQGIPGEAGESVKEARDERSQHITNPANLGPSRPGSRRGHAAPGQGLQADRHHHLHRLQGLRGGLRRMERHAVPDHQFDNTYQTMPDTDWNYWNLIKFNEDQHNDGSFAWLMRKHQCMHCADPGCLRGVSRRWRHRAVLQRHRRFPAGKLHRLPVLRLRLPLQYPEVQSRHQEGLQVHAVLRPRGSGAGAGVHQSRVPPAACTSAPKTT